MAPYLQEFPSEPICALETYMWNMKISAQFWQQLVSRANRNLWPDISRGFIAPKTITPDAFTELVEEFHQFRNRIAHHNKIWHLDLYRKYLVMIEILESIEPQFSAFVMKEVEILDLIDEQPKCRNLQRQ